MSATQQAGTQDDPFAMIGNPFARPVAIDVSQNATEVYDTIMVQIEPELTSAQIDTLAEKYKDETPEQASAREQRYAKAYEEFDRRSQGHIGDMVSAGHAYQRQALRTIESFDRRGDEHALADMEKQLAA